VNVVIHALSHVEPIRDFFLNPSNYDEDVPLFPPSKANSSLSTDHSSKEVNNLVSKTTSKLVHKFGELMRKLWSKVLFFPSIFHRDILIIGVCIA
jgi:hypothetical protein